MLNSRNKHVSEREKILADGIQQVVAELRLVDVVDYVAFVRMDCLGNISDLVSSSSQLFMKVGTLRFAGEGDVHLNWNSTPAIDLAMQFHHQGVTVHFRLGLTAATASVTITFIAFEDTECGAEENTRQLRAAVEASLLMPRVG